jgi:hypothetical protein
MKFIRILASNGRSILINLNSVQFVSPHSTGKGSVVKIISDEGDSRITTDMHFNDLVSLIERAGAEIFA